MLQVYASIDSATIKFHELDPLRCQVVLKLTIDAHKDLLPEILAEMRRMVTITIETAQPTLPGLGKGETT